jgi:hypothetical protein
MDHIAQHSKGGLSEMDHNWHRENIKGASKKKMRKNMDRLLELEEKLRKAKEELEKNILQGYGGASAGMSPATGMPMGTAAGDMVNKKDHDDEEEDKKLIEKEMDEHNEKKHGEPEGEDSAMKAEYSPRSTIMTFDRATSPSQPRPANPQSTWDKRAKAGAMQGPRPKDAVKEWDKRDKAGAMQGPRPKDAFRKGDIIDMKTREKTSGGGISSASAKGKIPSEGNLSDKLVENVRARVKKEKDGVKKASVEPRPDGKYDVSPKEVYDGDDRFKEVGGKSVDGDKGKTIKVSDKEKELLKFNAGGQWSLGKKGEE